MHLLQQSRSGRAHVRSLALLTLGAIAAASLAACSAPSSVSTTALFGTAKHQQCTSVADVLSDGPDPSSDPVGYAQAQVLPLRQLKITYPALGHAVKALAGAYQAYSTTSGSARTTAALRVSKAEAAVNAICPGAAN